MTLGELQVRMSSTEFELWFARELLKQDECPNCGVEPRDLMEWHQLKMKCPVCQYEYARVRPYKPGDVARFGGPND